MTDGTLPEARYSHMLIDVMIPQGMTLTDVMIRLCRGLPIEWEVITEQGPGGSSPEVRLTGSPDRLKDAALRYCDGDLAQAMHVYGDDSWAQAIALHLTDTRTAEMADNAYREADRVYQEEAMRLIGLGLSDEDLAAGIIDAAHVRAVTIQAAFDDWAQFGPS